MRPASVVRGPELPVDHEDVPRPAGRGAEPAQQAVGVGVRGEPVDHLHVRANGHVLAEDAHRASAVLDQPAARPGRLEADEEDRGLRVRETAPEVVQDAAAGDHAARGDDDRGAADVVDLARLLHGARQLEASRVERAGARGHGLGGVRIQVLRVLAVEARRLDRHRAVHEGRQPRECGPPPRAPGGGRSAPASGRPRRPARRARRPGPPPPGRRARAAPGIGVGSCSRSP